MGLDYLLHHWVYFPFTLLKKEEEEEKKTMDANLLNESAT